MSRFSPLFAVAAILTVSTTAAGNDFTEACHQFGSAEVVFIGRIKSAPITRRISAEEQIEKARRVSDAAERATRAAYPLPEDISVTPMVVEVPFRGVTTADVLMWNREGELDQLDPIQSYLIYAERPFSRMTSDVIFPGRIRAVEGAEPDLRFLNAVAANKPGGVVYGSLRVEDPIDPRRLSPLGAVTLRVSINDHVIETATNPDGTFMLTGLPLGMLSIEPVLPDHLILPHQALGGQVRGGCLALHMRARLNGRIRGRVLLDTGEAFPGPVDLVPDDRPRFHSLRSTVFTNDGGGFVFTGVPPGSYLVGINLSRQPGGDAPFRPTFFPGTTDRAQATSIVVGNGTEHNDVDWIVTSRLGEGTIEVLFDTHGQPQKTMGVCVLQFGDDHRPSGGAEHHRGSDGPVIAGVVEGVRYRLIAHAQTSSGFAESESLDIIGTTGHRAIRLPVASISERASGSPCNSGSAQRNFSPSR